MMRRDLTNRARRMTPALSMCAVLFAGSALLGGCEAESLPNKNVDPTTPGPNTPLPAPDPVDVTVNPTGPITLEPPGVGPEPATRQRRRMDIDQLNAAFRRVTGGIGWTEMRGGREVDLFEDLASTLGRPDFIDRTDEDLEPSAMFQKFLDDAARSVCQTLIAEDQNRQAEDRTFFVEADPTDTLASSRERVAKNVQYLLLRFHGQQLATDAPELGPWLWLIESAEHVTEDQSTVWQTLCVGLFEHPGFYTY